MSEVVDTRAISNRGRGRPEMYWEKQVKADFRRTNEWARMAHG